MKRPLDSARGPHAAEESSQVPVHDPRLTWLALVIAAFIWGGIAGWIVRLFAKG